ncbi:MAG: SpoIIE family protein phosphatase [Candidatus Riflebacteria bacterium]|nr:SpoIIE family protein phosphatase [Candidatus Riflebacteria bacterium]
MERRQHKLATFSLIYGLLVVTPLFFSLLLCLHVLDHLKQTRLEEISENIEIRASSLISQLDAEYIFLPHFRELVDKILALPQFDESQIVKLAEHAFSRASQRFFVYVFDANGKMLSTGLAPENTEAGIDYIWRFAHDNTYEGEFRDRRGDLEVLVGRFFHPRKVKNSNDICHPIVNYGKSGLIYHRKRLANSKDKSGVVIFLDLQIEFERLLAEKTTQSSSSELPVFFVRANKSVFAGPGLESNKAAAIQQLSEEKSRIVHEGRLWRHFNFRNFNLFFGQQLGLDFYQELQLLAKALTFFLMLVGFAILWRNLQTDDSMHVSIRYKLVVIFLFAVYLPVLGLFMLSYNGLKDRRTVLENDARKGMQDVLYQIDSEFANKEEEIFANFERLYNDRSWHSQLNDNWEHNDILLRKHAGVPESGENFFNHLDIRNLQLKQLFTTARGSSNDRIKDINRIISLISLEKFMPQEFAKKHSKLRQSDFILKNMMENPILGFSSFFEQPGRLVEMEFEGSSFYWYWNFYPEADDSVAYMSANTRVNFNVENYLNSVLKRRRAFGNTTLILTAYFPAQQNWTPETARNEPDLLKLIKITEMSETLETARINYQNDKFLATCLAGIKLKGAIITCLFPQSQIDDQISNLRNQIYQGMALILVVSVLTGLLLSKNFLQPIAELNLGMKALRQRNTEFRIEIDSKDELGELGKTFNQMMVDVQEMLLAGAVQRCLIPDSFPEIEGYDCVIYNKMATDVGGDYADVFPLSDNRYLIVLGDVTGHGVSSSILTAMVKAQVFRFAGKNRDLPDILKSLSEMIYELMNYRKLMTFCALILDTRDNTCLFANAGHPFPVWCGRNGQIKELDQAALPLGVSPRRSNYNTVDGIFSPGDLMLLYTDGIAEGAGPDGKEFGFDRVKQIIIENRERTSEEVKNQLLKEFWQHYQREELDDDLTFVIIRRRLQQNRA